MQPMKYPDAYCVKCQSHTHTVGKHTVVMDNQARSRAMTGSCAKCGSDVYMILPKKVVSMHEYKLSKNPQSGIQPMSTGMLVRQRPAPTTSWWQLALLATVTSGAAFCLGMLLHGLLR